nr:MAG TPA: hypothetical protein [Caudoviricetes sp.]
MKGDIFKLVLRLCSMMISIFYSISAIKSKISH